MAMFRTMALAGMLALTLAACAQNPAASGGVDHSAHQPAPGAAATATPAAGRMAMMDAHMKKMREMHEKVTRATTSHERQALMAEHMKLMHEGMAMMGGMGGMRSMGAASAPMDMSTRHQMMEKRMEMMQSMMQMMLDRLGAPATARP